MDHHEGLLFFTLGTAPREHDGLGRRAPREAAPELLAARREELYGVARAKSSAHARDADPEHALALLAHGARRAVVEEHHAARAERMATTRW